MKRIHLQGFIVTLGALELTSRSIVSGAVRLCFAAVYSLFLGFGLAIGAEAYQKMSGKGIIGSEDYSCQLSHDPNGPWWQQTPNLFWGETFAFGFCAVCGTHRSHFFSVFNGATVFTVFKFAQSVAMESERACTSMSSASPKVHRNTDASV